jgi:hypothetical protein
VSLDDIAAENLSSADTAVVRALRARKATLGPAIGAVVFIKERIFLF